MESDKEMYKIFSAEPNSLFELIGASCQTNYSFQTVAVKEFSRTMDSLLEPDDPNQPRYVVEFQNWDDIFIYERIILEMACLSKENLGNIYYPLGDNSH